jgi:hypothetical protein
VFVITSLSHGMTMPDAAVYGLNRVATTGATGSAPAPLSDKGEVPHDAGKEEASASSADPSQSSAPWWKLVWCQERCHKPDMTLMYTVLAKAARKAGGVLVCHRKAAKYIGWRATNVEPHILLTDWREVKPSMQGLNELTGAGHSKFPVFIYVLETKTQTFHRVAAWAKSFRERDVAVLSELASHHQFAESCAEKLRNQSALSTMNYQEERLSNEEEDVDIVNNTKSRGIRNKPLAKAEPQSQLHAADHHMGPIISWLAQVQSRGIKSRSSHGADHLMAGSGPEPSMQQSQHSFVGTVWELSGSTCRKDSDVAA